MQAGANARNQASIRVLQKLGMTHEGTIRHAPRSESLESNEAGVIFAVLRDEWLPTG
jgi:RimJ/RimL family protein N-acetyltransferase